MARFSIFLLALMYCSSVRGNVLERIFQNECTEKSVPPGMCAVLFDDDGCEGWEHAIPEGYTELSWWYRNDAESVVVKKGCVFKGFDHIGAIEADRGERLLMDSRNFMKPYNMWKDLDRHSLVDDISATECTCYDQDDRRDSNRQRDQRPKIDPGSNIDPSKCPQMPAHACAVLFDEENCVNDDWDRSIILADGEEKSFSIINSMLNYKYKNEIESFMVRDGCVFEAYDDSDFSDDSLRARAMDGDLLINLNSHRNRKFSTLNNDIESVRCFCAS
eukprot:TRINITY_DN1460_c0_g1_i1.p1 TRINITY_DN1460_c0_g1~~TRINITY_DN1460_c0_g1_i1.p1  ORF type:complete len:290 (-),score=40.06 TRINITY_DN1460_c0_g1_i1:230-1054(-)